jgi:hypothetical protein
MNRPSLGRLAIGIFALSLAAGCDGGGSTAASIAPVASSVTGPKGAVSAQPAARPTKPGVPPPLEDESVTKTWTAPTTTPGASPIVVRVVKDGDRMILWGWGVLPDAKRLSVDLRFYDDEGAEKGSTSVQVPIEQPVAGRWYPIYSAGRFDTDRVALSVTSIVAEEGGKSRDLWRAPEKPTG